MGCLQLLFLKELSSLPPTQMIQSLSRNKSKLEILLFLSSALFAQVLSFIHFKHLIHHESFFSAPCLDASFVFNC